MGYVNNYFSLVFIEFFGGKKFNVFKALAVENDSQSHSP